MENNNFEEYFLSKFKTLFNEFIDLCILNVNDDNIKNDISSVKSILDKLNYSKIMIKYAKNDELYNKLMTFNTNIKIQNSKIWTLMPKINLDKILCNYNVGELNVIINLLKSMYCCSISYLKITEDKDDNGKFDPYKIVGEYSKQLSVDEMYEGVEIQKPDTYEFLMNQILDNFNLNESLKEINDGNIDNASNNINTFLETSNDKASANVLTSMLSGIKTELLNLKNDTTANNGGEGVKKIFNIAKKISENSFKNIDKTNINPLELWDLTTKLAVDTTKSDAIEIFSNTIRNQIIAKMNESAKNEN